jgi:hypothetical protein
VTDTPAPAAPKPDAYAPKDSAFLNEIRRVIHLKHYSLRTENILSKIDAKIERNGTKK